MRATGSLSTRIRSFASKSRARAAIRRNTERMASTLTTEGPLAGGRGTTRVRMTEAALKNRTPIPRTSTIPRPTVTGARDAGGRRPTGGPGLNRPVGRAPAPGPGPWPPCRPG